jgi:hypothetical protein
MPAKRVSVGDRWTDRNGVVWVVVKQLVGGRFTVATLDRKQTAEMSPDVIALEMSRAKSGS